MIKRTSILVIILLTCLMSTIAKAEQDWNGLYLKKITSLEIYQLDPTYPKDSIFDYGVYIYIEKKITKDKKPCRFDIAFGRFYPLFFKNEFIVFQNPSENPFTRFVHLTKIQEIISLGKMFKVTLRNGEEFTGNWVANEPIMYTHHFSDEPTFSLAASDSICNLPYKIDINNIKRISFEYYHKKADYELTKKSPTISETLILTNNTTMNVENGRIRDYCGHYGGTYIFHIRFGIYGIEVLNTEAQKKDSETIPLSKIDTIEFTRPGIREREIIIHTLDRVQIKTSLYLTAESYCGVCYEEGRFGPIFDTHDSFEGETDYGFFSMPLAQVKSIKINH